MSVCLCICVPVGNEGFFVLFVFLTFSQINFQISDLEKIGGNRFWGSYFCDNSVERY